MSDESTMSRILNGHFNRRTLLRAAGASTALVMVPGLLVACGGDDEDSGASSTSTTSSSAPTTVSGGGSDSSTPGADASPAGTDAPAGDVQTGGELIVGLASDPLSLDPHKTNLRVAQQVMLHIYDMLALKDDDGGFAPALAESWDVSDDGSTWTFTIRSGVKFHDGTDLDANAVKVSFDRAVAPETKSPYSKSILGPVTSVEAPDASTVVFTFPEAYAPFLEGLCQSFLGIISPAAIEKYGEDLGQNPVGSGPFMFKEYVEGSEINLVKNPDYNWASEVYDHDGPAHIDALSFRIIVENASRMATLETGEIHATERVPEDDVARLEDNKDLAVTVFPAPGVGDLMIFNMTSTPTDDLAVRQAINYAIDRETLSEALFAGMSKPLFDPLRPNMLGYWTGAEEEGYGYDPDKAEQLLDEAGWVKGADDIREKDGKKLALRFPLGSWAIGQKYAEAVQDMAKDIGIQLDLTTMETAAYNSLVDSGEYDVVVTRWTSTDSDILYALFHSSQIGSDGNNDARIEDSDLDELLANGRTTIDPAERAGYYEKAQQILVRQAVTVPLVQPNEIFAANQKLQGFKVDARSYMRLYDTWLKS